VGIFDINVDGVKVATYGSYSPAHQYRALAYSRSSLAGGTRTIKIVNTGAENPTPEVYYCHLDCSGFNC